MTICLTRQVPCHMPSHLTRDEINRHNFATSTTMSTIYDEHICHKIAAWQRSSATLYDILALIYGNLDRHRFYDEYIFVTTFMTFFSFHHKSFVNTHLL
jgi:hypothetical protein